jgi:hypothetical protein
MFFVWDDRVDAGSGILPGMKTSRRTGAYVFIFVSCSRDRIDPDPGSALLSSRDAGGPSYFWQKVALNYLA